MEFIEMVLFQVLLSILFYQCESVTEYAGEKFPTQFLEAEEIKATFTDLNSYLNALAKTVGFFATFPNDTDINKALGMVMTHVLLKRTLIDDGHKLTEEHRTLMNGLICKADNVVSHHVYDDQFTRGEDITYETFRVTQNFREHEVLIHSLKGFNKGRLKPWIKGKGDIHEYVQEIDEATLPKTKYVELIDDSYANYYIKIDDSDTCLSRLIYNLSPSPKNTELRPCRHDPFCHKNLHTSPSISYGLSHRMLNLWFYRTLKHCYWVSPQADEVHIDILCAFMYREAVYIARRGFFARDLFLEHIALCAFLGYEEFYRQRWFHKAISWMDDQGCIQENANVEINRTDGFITHGQPDEKELKKLRRSLKDRLSDPCHIHPMALLAVVLSHAIRYTAYLLPNS